jgi:hypothetical protein
VRSANQFDTGRRRPQKRGRRLADTRTTWIIKVQPPQRVTYQDNSAAGPKVVPERMKVPMVAMVLSPVSRDRAHRGLDGDLQAAGDRRRTCMQAGAERRMAAGRLSCLARNGVPGSPRRWPWGGTPGEESCPAAIAAEAIEASAVLRPDQAIERRRGRVQERSEECRGELGFTLLSGIT